MSVRKAHYVIAHRSGGWVVRLVGANGTTVSSSSSQLYTRKRDARRAISLAIEAAGQPIRELDER